MRKIYSAILVLLFSLSAIGVSAAELETKFITYSIASQVTSTINEADSSVTVLMPVGTDLASLVPEFTLSEGAKAFIGETEQVSGTVVNFSEGAVNYNIVNDTEEQLWSVSVKNAVMVTFMVDMNGAELADDDVVYVTGSFNGWNEPGTGASVMMTKTDSGWFVADVYMPEKLGEVKYKYFIGASWNNGDTYNGSGDRLMQVDNENNTIIDIWKEETVTVKFVLDATEATLEEGDVIYVTGSFAQNWNRPGTGKSVLMTQGADNMWTATVPMTKNLGDIMYKYFINATWANGDQVGDKPLTIGEENITIDPADVWKVIISVDDNSLANVAVYPNPFNNMLTIANLDDASEVMLSTLVGQVVDVQTVIDSKVTVNTSELKAGIYLVTVKNSAGISKSFRVVKQ